MKNKNGSTLAMQTLILLSYVILSAMTPTDSKKNPDLNENTIPADSAWTKKKAETWFNDHKWLNGLQMIPHSSIDKQHFAVQYHANKTGWDKAFDFLKEKDLANLKPGKYEIDGENVYATVTEAPTKELETTAWESHRQYADIHYLIKGQEKIGIVPISLASITKEYDTAKDLINYSASGKYYIAKPGTFFIMLPEDAHRPSVKADGFDTVKKIVIKIKTGS